jgi:hypothetical protein
MDLFDNYGGQEYIAPFLGSMEARGGFAAFYGETFVGCGGIIKVSEYRGQAWVILNAGDWPFIQLHRAIIKGLRDNDYRRIEAFVDPTFEPAIRWMKMLGFECETPYKPFLMPDGRGMSEWGIIK